jgi:TDG/mug DNA glycosylase family protein
VGRQPVEDVVAPGLLILFCGINPGLESARVGHHFARAGNRFWKALHRSGFTPDLLDPKEDRRLLAYGLGVTNLVDRPTPSAAHLEREELQQGAKALSANVQWLHPKAVAVLGLGAYRVGFGRPRALLGEQPGGLCGARLWALPNPSGIQAHYQLDDLVELFSALRREIV